MTSAPALYPIGLLADSPLAIYLKATTSVCPFIEPGTKVASLFACDIRPECKSADAIHPRLFEQLVPVIERFRDHRRDLPNRQQRLLICHTAMIHMPESLDADTTRLLAWPNWLSWSLKQLYTPKEIVFGIVRKNVTEKSAIGLPIPIAPFHAVIIRSRVVGSDGRFFQGNQPMFNAMMQADDDGQDAHALVPSPPAPPDPIYAIRRQCEMRITSNAYGSGAKACYPKGDGNETTFKHPRLAVAPKRPGKNATIQIFFSRRPEGPS